EGHDTDEGPAGAKQVLQGLPGGTGKREHLPAFQFPCQALPEGQATGSESDDGQVVQRRPQVPDSWSLPRWHFLYFLPLPHQQGSLRPILRPVFSMGASFGSGSYSSSAAAGGVGAYCKDCVRACSRSRSSCSS